MEGSGQSCGVVAADVFLDLTKISVQRKWRRCHGSLSQELFYDRYMPHRA
jgi:hypothetical protein